MKWISALLLRKLQPFEMVHGSSCFCERDFVPAGTQQEPGLLLSGWGWRVRAERFWELRSLWHGRREVTTGRGGVLNHERRVGVLERWQWQGDVQPLSLSEEVGDVLFALTQLVCS